MSKLKLTSRGYETDDSSGGSGSVTVDSVNTSGVTLASLDASQFIEGQTVWVRGVASSFRLLFNAGLTVDHSTIESANGYPGAQWVRQLGRNKYWESQTASTTVKTLSEVSRRLTNAILSATTTVTLTSNAPSNDNGTWTCRPAAGATRVQLKFVGTTTTLYSGTVTATTAIGALPSIGEDSLTDSAIPVSFTASGLLGTGIVYQRTNSTTRYWYAAKDEGSKTIRISRPSDGTGTLAQSNLAVNDTYNVLRLSTIYDQYFAGVSVPASYVQSSSTGALGFVVYSFLDDRSTNPLSNVDSISYYVCTFGSNKQTGPGTYYNCAWYETSTGGYGFGQSQAGIVNIFSGMFFGSGAIGYAFNNGQIVSTSTVGTLFQGCFASFNRAYALSVSLVFYDCTATQLISANGGARVYLNTISGSGNTGKLINILDAGTKVYYTSAPNAASTTDANPYKIGTTSFNALPQVASLPTQDCGIMASAVT